MLTIEIIGVLGTLLGLLVCAMIGTRLRGRKLRALAIVR
jgi:hypothetical protein